MPDGCESLDSFRKNTDLKLPQKLTRLRENKCMAPYFVSEEQTDEEIIIDSARHLYPVSATILPRKAYDSRLSEIVHKSCHGCMRFGGNASDVTGHHGEISLDGMCFERQKAPYFAFYYAVEHFWKLFEKNDEQMRALIDSGRVDKVVNWIGVHINFMIVPYIAVMKRGDRYVVLLSAMADQVVSALNSYLVRRAPNTLTHWDFYDHLPKGVFYYLPERRDYDLRTTPPKVIFSLEQCDRPRFHVIVKIAPCDDPQFDSPFENFLYLCAEVGENKLLAAGGMMDFLPYDADGSEGQPPNAFSQVLENTYKHPPLCDFFRDWQSYSFTLCGQSVTTRIAHLSVDLISGGDRSLVALHEMGIPVGTLTLQTDMHSPHWHEDYSHIMRLIGTNLIDNGLIQPVGTRFCDSRICFDFLVMDKPIVSKAIRSLTPPLRAFRARYTVHEGKEKITARVDYIM